MCGIAGYIGVSKEREVTYELINKLFKHLELRGIDASGLWGTFHGEGKGVVYHKEPVRSSIFVKQDFWSHQVPQMNLDMLFIHARATSTGNGHSSTNSNNHPFVSDDKRIGMMHNGTIGEAEFLKEKYLIRSNTDSEVLLRMYEHGLNDLVKILNVPEAICSRISGIKNTWSTITKGAMAVAIGERVDDFTRHMFLFRNKKRPLWLADLRESLGQIFFFSSPDVWHAAVKDSELLTEFCESGIPKLIQMPVKQIWAFTLDSSNFHLSNPDHIQKINVSVKPSSKIWENEPPLSIKGPEIDLPIITELDDLEQVIPIEVDQEFEEDHYSSMRESFYANEENIDGDLHDAVVEEISDLAQDIGVSLSNSYLEGSISSTEYLEKIEQLHVIRNDLAEIHGSLF